MDAIFTHHDSPFFKSAIPVTVELLPYNEFSPFLRKKFIKGQRKIDDKTLEKVFAKVSQFLKYPRFDRPDSSKIFFRNTKNWHGI